jgi:hypothetical protein
MDETISRYVLNLRSSDKDTQNHAYYSLMTASEQPVDWAYEVWDSLVADLKHKDNHLRAIAAQLLANLAAYSDPQKRIMNDFEALLNGTRDERFVTARHTLQSIWKIGLAGQEQRQLVREGLARRFADCTAEKNCTLIRYDIAQALRHFYDVAQDEAIRECALALIETEPNIKYRKKYATVWK